MKNVRELYTLSTFKERFEYLILKGTVGASTFGYDRYLNQQLYMSRRWRETRDEVIIRDRGCDLGIEGHELNYGLIVHHINPITLDDIERNRSCLYDLDNLIVTSHATHNAIHYGNMDYIVATVIERTPNDTCPWR